MLITIVKTIKRDLALDLTQAMVHNDKKGVQNINRRCANMLLGHKHLTSDVKLDLEHLFTVSDRWLLHKVPAPPMGA